MCKTSELTCFNKLNICDMRFQVLMAASMKITVFWDVVLCSILETDRRFTDAYCLHHQGNDGGSKHL
jgi:hypothetical protein